MHVCLHSCGDVRTIIPDLIELGLDILHPIQPTAMDRKELAREFGGHITFCGGIDVQDLLPCASPQQIREEIKDIVGTLGIFGGGLILNAANSIMPETPFENIEAMFETCHKYSAC